MNRIVSVVIACFTLACFASLGHAELQPAEVAILVNKKSPQSRQIATYYAQQRGIPNNQICAIDMPGTEELDRATWDKSIRPAIRRWIATNKLQDKIRCMVTTWDVPLKIGPSATADSLTRRRVRLLTLERQRRMERLLDFLSKFDEIATSSPPPANLSGLTKNSTLQAVTAELGNRLKASETRINALPDGDEKQKAINTLTQLSVATAGLEVVTQNMKRAIDSGKGSDRMQQEYNFGTGRLTGLKEAQGLIGGLPASIERDTNAIVVIERSSGIAGTVTWIDSQLAELGWATDKTKKNETYASFDSELSLVLESNYPILRWLPNYLHYNYDSAPIRQVTRTLMISRLEAPTIELTKALIDKAIAVEKTGLQGKVYLDARGAGSLEGPNPQVGTIPDYDRAVLLANKLISEHTSLEVVLDNKPELFAAGACPDAALYCGWYALAQYADSFTWKPGSIGYHMASAEASTIRNPESQVWCKRMLDEGVAGTIGPVYEPYLLAFPRPNEFFAMLMTGEYTYIEAVYRSKTTNSWTITTIGDPLYNPFKANPALKTPPPEYNRVLGKLLKN